MPEFQVLTLIVWMGNGIKASTLAGHDRPESDGLTKGDELQGKVQKRQIDTMPVHRQAFPSSTDSLFPYRRYL